jgi:hypothetical protein
MSCGNEKTHGKTRDSLLWLARRSNRRLLLILSLRLWVWLLSLHLRRAIVVLLLLWIVCLLGIVGLRLPILARVALLVHDRL